MLKTKNEFLTEILDHLVSDLSEIGYEVEKLIIKNKEDKLCVTVEKDVQAENVTANLSESTLLQGAELDSKQMTIFDVLVSD